MAKSLNFRILYCFLFIYFLLFASSVEGVARGSPFNEASQVEGHKQEVGKTEVVEPAALCERASQTWSGNCGNTQNCDKQCISWEGAKHGACHVRNGKHMCFCYFDHC